MNLLLRGHESCSETGCPLSFCDCPCHKGMGVMHCMPCCRTAACSKCGKHFNNVTVDYSVFDKPRES